MRLHRPISSSCAITFVAPVRQRPSCVGPETLELLYIWEAALYLAIAEGHRGGPGGMPIPWADTARCPLGRRIARFHPSERKKRALRAVIARDLARCAPIPRRAMPFCSVPIRSDPIRAEPSRAVPCRAVLCRAETGWGASQNNHPSGRKRGASRAVIGRDLPHGVLKRRRTYLVMALYIGL